MPGTAGSDVKLGFYVGLGIIGALLIVGLAQGLIGKARGR